MPFPTQVLFNQLTHQSIPSVSMYQQLQTPTGSNQVSVYNSTRYSESKPVHSAINLSLLTPPNPDRRWVGILDKANSRVRTVTTVASHQLRSKMNRRPLPSNGNPKRHLGPDKKLSRNSIVTRNPLWLYAQLILVLSITLTQIIYGVRPLERHTAERGQ